jgi:hypothetical protein
MADSMEGVETSTQPTQQEIEQQVIAGKLAIAPSCSPREILTEI